MHPTTCQKLSTSRDRPRNAAYGWLTKAGKSLPDVKILIQKNNTDGCFTRIANVRPSPVRPFLPSLAHQHTSCVFLGVPDLLKKSQCWEFRFFTANQNDGARLSQVTALQSLQHPPLHARDGTVQINHLSEVQLRDSGPGQQGVGAGTQERKQAFAEFTVLSHPRLNKRHKIHPPWTKA